MAEIDERLVDAIKQVMKAHGSDLLFPEDEFDCCAEEVAALFGFEGWAAPERMRYTEKEPPGPVVVPMERLYRLLKGA